MMARLIFTIIVSSAMLVSGIAQNNDIMLNASSDSKPREISLGLPTNNYSAVQIYEDGLPVSYFKYQMFPYKSWHGGVSASVTGKMAPMETAMRYGEVNNYVNSYNKLWSHVVRNTLHYTIGTFGQHKIDYNISGLIPDAGVGLSFSTYQNLDPGSNHLDQVTWKDRHQFYKAGVIKMFEGSNRYMTFVYQHVNYMSISENYGPFIFVGDGSVKQAKGFSLGKDTYLPGMMKMEVENFKTGEKQEVDLKKGSTDKTHHLTYTFNYQLNDNVTLSYKSRLKLARAYRQMHNISGAETVREGAGYTYKDGKTFVGQLQRRTLTQYDSYDNTWMNNAEMLWQGVANNVVLGIDYYYDRARTTASSASYAHEVEKSPKMILWNGKEYYNFNTAGEYYKGEEHKTAAYIGDKWHIADALYMEAFARLEFKTLNGEAANNIGGDHSNDRRAGFNLTRGKLTTFDRKIKNGAAGVDINYKIIKGLSFRGQGVFTRANKSLFDFGGYLYPDTKPTDTKFGQFGLAYVNNTINIVSQLVYISQSNYSSRSMFQHELQKEVNGAPAGFVESLSLPVTYGIESLGWTTDAVITPVKGLALHLQFAIRNPQYKDFEFAPTFSDGVTEHYDFSDKNVTNLHKVEISIDPSYAIDRWRFWLSGRYISKQYINKTNSLYFKERIETFGGVDYSFNHMLGLSLNVINMLNQKGASGNISSADLVEDGSKYKNYLMAGTFIRPFTVELSLKLSL